MEENEAKCFLCMTALCLSPTNRDATLLKALGSILKIPKNSQAGALTMIGNPNASKKPPYENMLERAEHQAAGLRSTLTPQAALEGFCLLLLLFIQGTGQQQQGGGGGGEKGGNFSSSRASLTDPSSSSSAQQMIIKFDARTSVILRRLAFLLRIKLSTVCALEEIAIFNLTQEATKLQQQNDEKDSQTKKNIIRGLKIGGAAAAAGGLLAVTGGLAAPAIATGLASLGLGTVAAVTTTATVSALLGAGGAGLGAYKMTRRTQGVQYFKFNPINDETLAEAVLTKSTNRVVEDHFTSSSRNPTTKSTKQQQQQQQQQQQNGEKLKGMTVYICISGYLHTPGPGGTGTGTGTTGGDDSARVKFNSSFDDEIDNNTIIVDQQQQQQQSPSKSPGSNNKRLNIRESFKQKSATFKQRFQRNNNSNNNKQKSLASSTSSSMASLSSIHSSQPPPPATTTSSSTTLSPSSPIQKRSSKSNVSSSKKSHHSKSPPRIKKNSTTQVRDTFFNFNKSAAHSPDFYAPWGAQPKYLYVDQILDRFYSVVAPEKRVLVPLLLQTYEGQEDELMDELARRYNGIHPKQLCPIEARRDYYFEGSSDQQQIYKSLLFRAGMKLQSLTSNKNRQKEKDPSIPDWQYSEATLKEFMDTERSAWDSFKDATVHYLIDVDNDELTEEQRKQKEAAEGGQGGEGAAADPSSKEEMDQILADLFEKFEGEKADNNNTTKENGDNNNNNNNTRASIGTKTFDETAALETEKYKIRLEPTNKVVDMSRSLDAVELGHGVYWWRNKVARYGDQYTLIWEPELLLQVGECVQNLIKESVSKGALTSMQFTAFSALFLAMALPVVITSFVSTLDNYWTRAVEAADEAGQLMADALMSDAHGNRPVVLIGYSTGGRVVASCLEALARIASGGQETDDIINVDDFDSKKFSFEPSDTASKTNRNLGMLNQNERKRRRRAASIVRDAVIIGAPCDTSVKKWTQRRSVVVGRLINVYSPKDWVLALIYRYKSWSVLSLAGLQKVESKPSFLHSPIENYNVSEIVNGHGDYHMKIQEILSHVGIGDVNTEEFHSDYFATN